MNVGCDLLPRRTSVRDRPALSVEGENVLTYGELAGLRDRWAVALQSLGVQPGDRVGLMLHNCPEYWALYLATGLIGAITVRVNFRLAGPELEYVLNDSGCSVLVAHDSLLPTVAEARPRTGCRHVLVLPEDGRPLPSWAAAAGDWLPAAGQPAPPASGGADDPHMIMYTSGTTGRPKGAVWTHRGTLMFGAMQILQWGGSETRVAMTTGPLYHVGSMEDLLLPTLMMGGHAITLRSGSFSIRRALAVIAAQRVTDVLLFPAMIYQMLALPDLADFDLGHLRTVLTGGSPLLDWAVERFTRMLPGASLYTVYGLTEGGGISVVLEPGELAAHPAAAGRPLPLAAFRLERDDGTEAAHGEVGEILLAGPNAAAGYWNRPEETAAAFGDGWVRTGDLGVIGDDGLLFVKGRKKDMIRTGDENVYAAEVERVLAEHAAVLEAAVFGIPDAVYGEAVCAAVVVRPGSQLTVAEVVDHCRQRLAGYKKPRHVTFLSELPRNPTGKVVKARLIELLTVGDAPSAAIPDASR